MSNNLSNLSGTERDVFEALQKYYDGQLEFLNYYSTGSTARVFHVKIPVGYKKEFKIDRIIKVYRHEEDVVKLIEMEAVFNQEVRALVSVTHTNVISIHDVGSLTLPGNVTTFFYIMEYLPDADDLDKWLEANAKYLKIAHIYDLLIQACAGLEALHGAKILHCDLKFGNMFVDKNHHLKIADLGFSKEIRGGAGETLMRTTLEFFPNVYKDFIQEVKDPRRTIIRIPRTKLDQQ